ncbi:MFS transporter [Streptomyces odontomachi]|uniref:MFS transporter n=1 Tax=Streptomyces odontomachi TaxID=2944940 RepID=UPI00210DBF9B|nr:MFS transporter [Streptomyces sp. ODS25]
MNTDDLAPSPSVRSEAPTVQIGAVFARMPLTRVHVKIGIALFVALAIESWEMLSLTYVSSDLRHGLHISTGQLGLVISALFLGMIPGTLVWGVIADRIGRQRTCLYSFTSYGLLALLGSAAPDYRTLLVARMLAGFAFSGVFTITFPYFEELLPVRSRGRAAVFLAAGWPVGTLLAVGAAVLVGSHGWRWVVVASAVASLWVLVIRRWVPESPYWLARTGRSDEAHEALARLGADGIDRRTVLVAPDLPAGSLATVLRGRLGRVTLIQVVANFLFSWGYWGLQTWLPTLLQDRGLSASSSLGFVALSAVFMFPGYASAAVLTGRLGRKKVFVAYVLAAALGGFFFAQAHSLAELYTGIFLLSFFSLGAWGVWDAWVGELYPSPVRGAGYGLGVFGQRVANTLAPTLIGFLLAHASGFSSTVLFIDLFLAATALLGLALPETEGKELS